MNFLILNFDKIISRTLEHISLVSISLFLSTILGSLLGIYISKNERLASIVLKIISTLFTIPSLSLFGILISLLSPFKVGIGKVPATIALILYTLLPITRNTYTAIKNIDRGIVESAKGMGMKNKEVIFKVIFPLTLPYVMAGIRVGFVLGVGIGVVSFLIGAGGLGYFIFEGIERSNKNMILIGVFMISLLSIIFNYLLYYLEKVLTPKGLRG
ncbi:MAG: ABC transporter permease [Caldisericia bacterium]|nr:ABC transporter permease [Caldisericia bacterium]